MLQHSHSLPSNPKRVIVIGAGGFIGSAIAQRLVAVGANTVELTRKDVDLLSADAASALAARLKPGDSIVFVSAIAPAKTVTQLMDNLRMAEAACAAFDEVNPSHLLYISSDAVYTDDANPVTEDSPVAPSTAHGMMHAARELMFRTTVTCPFAVLRPTLVYGAADPHSGYGPNRFRRQAAKGEPISLFGEGEEQRDHVAVEDVASLATRIVQHTSAGSLNAVTGVSTSFFDVAHMVAAQFDPPAEVKCLPRAVPRPHLLHRFFDISQCLKSFPDFRYTNLAEGIERIHRETREKKD
jgi:nucleoside-diphosphate-sugar epimerase